MPTTRHTKRGDMCVAFHLEAPRISSFRNSSTQLSYPENCWCVNFHVPPSTPSRGSGRFSRTLKSISPVNVQTRLGADKTRVSVSVSTPVRLYSSLHECCLDRSGGGGSGGGYRTHNIDIFPLLRPETGLKMSKVRARKPGRVRRRCDER